MSAYLSGTGISALPVVSASSVANFRTIESAGLVNGSVISIPGAAGHVPRQYYWDSGNSNADDGYNWIKPTDVGGAGRAVLLNKSAPLTTVVTATADVIDHLVFGIDVTNLYGKSWDNTTFQFRVKVISYGAFSTYAYSATLDWWACFRRDTGALSMFTEGPGNGIAGVAPTGGVLGSPKVYSTYGFLANGDNKTCEFHITPLRNAAQSFQTTVWVDVYP